MTLKTETINSQQWVGGDAGALEWLGLTVERSDTDEVRVTGESHPDLDQEDLDFYLSRAEATRLLLALAKAISA